MTRVLPPAQTCGDMFTSTLTGSSMTAWCIREEGHGGPHKNSEGMTWTTVNPPAETSHEHEWVERGGGPGDRWQECWTCGTTRDIPPGGSDS